MVNSNQGSTFNSPTRQAKSANTFSKSYIRFCVSPVSWPQMEIVQKDNKALSAERKAEVDKATLPKNGIMSWSVYEESVEANSKKYKKIKKLLVGFELVVF